MKNLLRTLTLVFWLISPMAYAGVFIGGSVGQTNLEETDLGIGFDADDIGFKLFGGKRILKFFSLEGGYIDFGEPDDVLFTDALEVELFGFDIFAVGTIPLGTSWELFGKLGFIYWEEDKTLTTGPVPTSESDGFDAAFGIGLAYKVSEHLLVRGEYEVFDIDGKDDVTFTSVGIEFRF
ncbi:MAG: outer membrane beta-barrel protein [Acidobacteriota bacterium]